MPLTSRGVPVNWIQLSPALTIEPLEGENQQIEDVNLSASPSHFVTLPLVLHPSVTLKAS